MWIDRYVMAAGLAAEESFHVLHKIPVGDTPYVKAKHVQLVDKDPDRAIALFWAAINAGDRVDSALKDMAVVMKQQNRPEEAIEAIKSLRCRCTDQAQEALDNVLLDLYKRCGRLNDQIALLKRKLNLIHEGLAFNGKRTKTARSQGRKFQVSIEQEASRLLGNLGWAYMQQSNYIAAEAVYRKALSIEPDGNKVCNLGICFMKQGKFQEAKITLESVPLPGWNATPSQHKSYERAQEMLSALRDMKSLQTNTRSVDSWNPLSSPARTSLKHHLPGIVAATSGFGHPEDEDGADEVEDFDRSLRSTRKRSHEAENELSQLWQPSALTTSSSSCPQAPPVETSTRLPLTSDWTNKAYGRPPCSEKSRSKIDNHRSGSWKECLDDDKPPSVRRCLAAVLDDESSGDLEEVIPDVDSGIVGYSGDEARSEGEMEGLQDRSSRCQRRLKVFEEITL